VLGNDAHRLLHLQNTATAETLSCYTMIAFCSTGDVTGALCKMVVTLQRHWKYSRPAASAQVVGKQSRIASWQKAEVAETLQDLGGYIGWAPRPHTESCVSKSLSIPRNICARLFASCPRRVPVRVTHSPR
jgi:hypothetical protein